MKKIFLIRHGKPAKHGTYDPEAALPGHAVGRMLDDYANTGVDCSSPPPEALVRLLAGTTIVLASPLRRAIESARLIYQDSSVRRCAWLREADLPYGYFSSLQMNPEAWMFLMRTLWFGGFHRNAEPLRAAWSRARTACKEVLGTLESADMAAVFGHGFINLFMLSVFLSKGWRLGGAIQTGYWACNTIQVNRP